MSLFADLYRGETRFDVVGARRRWFTLSAILVAISVLALAVLQLNLSVDFRGGTLAEAANPAGASVAAFRQELAGLGLEGARVQLVGGGAGVRVQTGPLDEETQEALVARVAEVAGVAAQDVSLGTVGPVWGQQITSQALRALVIFLAAAAVYISWRFDWKMAGTAMVALFHDLFITAGVYAITRLEVTPATVIAVLTILGYSLYDTVVVYDKVLENVHDLGERRPYSEIMNLSVNQVLARSLNTSLTSLLPVGALLFVGSFLLGATTLREFALGLFIGIAAGTYSSVAVAVPLLAGWKEREEHWKRVRRRAERQERDLTPAMARSDRPESAPARPPSPSGAVPRPPRQRRRKRR